MKKLLTLLFAVAMTLSLSSVSFAHDAPASDKPMDKKEAKAEKKAKKKKAKADKKDDMKKDEAPKQ